MLVLGTGRLDVWTDDESTCEVLSATGMEVMILVGALELDVGSSGDETAGITVVDAAADDDIGPKDDSGAGTDEVAALVLEAKVVLEAGRRIDEESAGWTVEVELREDDSGTGTDVATEGGTEVIALEVDSRGDERTGTTVVSAAEDDSGVGTEVASLEATAALEEGSSGDETGGATDVDAATEDARSEDDDLGAGMDVDSEAVVEDAVLGIPVALDVGSSGDETERRTVVEATADDSGVGADVATLEASKALEVGTSGDEAGE